MLAYSSPLEAEAVEGEVVLVAPEGAASISLTPDAAEKTARRLDAAARTARDGSAAANTRGEDGGED